MEYIVVGFSKPKSKFQPFSWIIRLIQNTSYSHVYIRFYSKTFDRWLVYQASGSKVNFIGWERFQKEEVIAKEFSLQISLEAKQNMIQYCIDNIGLPYDIIGILGIGIVLLCRLFNKDIQNPFKTGPNSLFCSKSVEYILIDFLNENPEINPELILPKDIYQYLEKQHG